MCIDKKTQGFTLIETIIVLAIFGLVIPSVFSIITAIIRQQADIYRLTEMKRQGDYAMGFIKQTILEQADSIYQFDDGTNEYQEVCVQNGHNADFFQTDATNNGNDFRFSTKSDPNRFLYFRVDNDPANHTSVLLFGDSSTGNEEPITSQLVFIPYFHIECSQKNDFASPLMSIQFAVTYKNISGQKVNLNPLTYQTKFKLTD